MHWEFYYFGGMKSILLLMLMLLFAVGTQAQVFKEGVIVTKEGDTLTGLVANNDEKTMTFKEDKHGTSRIIAKKEISAFRTDTTTYVKHTIEVLRGNFPEKVEDFLLVVIDGPVQLLEYKGKSLFGSEHMNYYLLTAGQVPYRVNTDEGNFRKTMKWYFEEYAELAQRIKNKELGYDNLHEIVNTFNTWFIENRPAEEEAPAEESN